MRLTTLWSRKPRLWAFGVAVIVLITCVLLKQWHAPSQDGLTSGTGTPSQAAPKGPPWIYGRADARFAIVGYADLTCPYCRAHFPVLRQWIDNHADVNWQWHHLPLRSHEPKAGHAARLAECAGELGGNSAFWNAVAWIYQHDASDTSGLIRHANIGKVRAAFQSCVDATRLDAFIQNQAAEAVSEGIQGTPTLRALDRSTGRTITLSGPADGDALLSAIDFLVSPDGESIQSPGKE